MRLGLSAGATGLLRGLIQRAKIPRDRVLLIDWRSVDWQSLTFIGERHEITLRLTGSEASVAAARMCKGLKDCEFVIPGQIVADVAVIEAFHEDENGAVTVKLEALTITE